MRPIPQRTQAEHPATYRGRFAPSPTGTLHLGSLLTAVASYLQAKSQNGEWALRIDDIDSERCSSAATDAILRCLERFHLRWDGPVVYQRMRTERYRAVFDTLQRSGLVYGCRCSRKALTGRLLYPGTCRTRQLSVASGPVAARISTDDRSICFVDHLQGPQSHDLMKLTGDFIVRRRDGTHAYHLATVIDDADADVTEVIRGSDLLDSTPRQIYLQQVLQFPTPRYAHTPVLLAEDGRKLSKGNAAPPVDALDPSHTLTRVLGWLKHAPPPSLERSPVDEILEWAIAHWNLNRLRGVTTLQEAGAHPVRQPSVRPTAGLQPSGPPQSFDRSK